MSEKYASEQDALRTLYVCVWCEGIYADNPVSCDCLQKPEKFIVTSCRYSLPNRDEAAS